MCLWFLFVEAVNVWHVFLRFFDSLAPIIWPPWSPVICLTLLKKVLYCLQMLIIGIQGFPYRMKQVLLPLFDI